MYSGTLRGIAGLWGFFENCLAHQKKPRISKSFFLEFFFQDKKKSQIFQLFFGSQGSPLMIWPKFGLVFFGSQTLNFRKIEKFHFFWVFWVQIRLKKVVCIFFLKNRVFRPPGLNPLATKRTFRFNIL